MLIEADKNGIGDKAALAIAERLKSLTELYIGSNGLTAGCEQQLRDKLRNIKLTL